MRSITLVVAMIALLASASACGRTSEMPFGTAESQVIRQRTTDFAAAFNAKGIDKITAFYSPESVFMPPNSPTRRGKETIAEYYKTLYNEGATELRMESQNVGGHGPLAYESGTYSLNRRPPTGPHTRDRGKYMFIWRNTNGQWLIEYTMWSSDLPERVDIAPVK